LVEKHPIDNNNHNDPNRQQQQQSEFPVVENNAELMVPVVHTRALWEI
jgi:hypothetical protein